jgi:hypothetical protein
MVPTTICLSAPSLKPARPTSGRLAIPGAVSRKAHPPNQPKPNPAKLDPLQLEKRDHALGLGLRLGERRHRGGDLGQHLLALAGR